MYCEHDNNKVCNACIRISNADLIAEVERLTEIDEMWTGCGSGDCLHESTQKCVDALVETNYRLIRGDEFRLAQDNAMRRAEAAEADRDEWKALALEMTGVSQAEDEQKKIAEAEVERLTGILIKSRDTITNPVWVTRRVAYLDELKRIAVAAEALAKRRGEALGKAQDMIVLLMNQRQWGAATGALLEDSVVKDAMSAVDGRLAMKAAALNETQPTELEYLDEQVQCPECGHWNARGGGCCEQTNPARDIAETICAPERVKEDGEDG